MLTFSVGSYYQRKNLYNQ